MSDGPLCMRKTSSRTSNIQDASTNWDIVVYMISAGFLFAESLDPASIAVTVMVDRAAESVE